MNDSVRYEPIDAETVLITLDRPATLNAIDGSLIDGLEAALDAAESDPELRAIVLTGAGRGFSSGADLSGTGTAWNPPARTRMKTTYDAQIRLTDLLTRMYELPLPIVAAVNGVAVGGGLAFALHCDVRIAAESARFGAVFIKAGFTSLDMGVSYLLPHIVGAGRARELLMTARIIDAAESERIGLVHSVVPDDQVVAAAIDMAHLISSNNEFGVWQTKIGLNAALDAPSLRHAKEIENRAQILSTFTRNPEAVRVSRAEKQPPAWERM